MNTNYEAFTKFLEEECMHETVYDDSEGRTILVIGLLDAFTMAHRWGVRMVREEREACAKVCESRQTPGTGSVAILNGAADAIRERDETA